jgi:translation initiation factor IF-3
MKEMRFRPKIDDHDYNFKCKHMREFLQSGSKVRAYVMFRGRELAYTDRGRELLERVAQDMSDIALIDVPIKREGRNMSMILGPNPETMKKLRDTQPSQKEKKPSGAKKTEGEAAKSQTKPEEKSETGDASELTETASSTSGDEKR